MERRLTVILAADDVGYSSLMEADEDSTAKILNDKKKIISDVVLVFNGRDFGRAGDSIMLEFSRPTDAVSCAIENQNKIHASNVNVPESKQMLFHIVINLGDVIVDGDNLFGDGVSIAARPESNADPGGINISSLVYRQVETKFDTEFSDSGDQYFKNIPRPIQVFKWVQDQLSSATDDICMC